MQTVLGARGNCQSACLASILELDIGEVPNFYDAGPDDSDWWNALRTWLRSRGWGLITINLGEGFSANRLEGWQIVSGESHRGYCHATVWKDGEMVHDPHPDKTGIKKAETVDLLYPIDASAMQFSRIVAEGLEGRKG